MAKLRQLYYVSLAALMLAIRTWAQLGDVDVAAAATRAQQAQQAGDYRRAAEIYEKLLAGSPNSAELLSNVGVMRHLAGEDDVALRSFAKALRLNPKLLTPNLFSGLALLRLGRAREALPYLEHAHSLNDSVLTNVALAKAHVALRDFRRANEDYYRATRQDPQHAESWFGLGVTYRNLLNAVALRIGKSAPDSPAVKAPLADFSAPVGRGVMLAREKAAMQHPADLDAAVRLAQSYQSLALDALARAVQLEPNSARTHLALAEAQAESQNLLSAIPEYESAIRAAPQSEAGYLGLATAYWRSGDSDRALGPLQQALRLAPGDPEANAIMADLLVHSGEFTQASSYATKALKGNPDLAIARVALAKIDLGQNRPADAVAELQQTLDADSDGTYHYILYRALKQLGRSREASEALRIYRARHALFRKDAADTH